MQVDKMQLDYWRMQKNMSMIVFSDIVQWLSGVICLKMCYTVVRHGVSIVKSLSNLMFVCNLDVLYEVCSRGVRNTSSDDFSFDKIFMYSPTKVQPQLESRLSQVQVYSFSAYLTTTARVLFGWGTYKVGLGWLCSRESWKIQALGLVCIYTDNVVTRSEAKKSRCSNSRSWAWL